MIAKLFIYLPRQRSNYVESKIKGSFVFIPPSIQSPSNPDSSHLNSYKWEVIISLYTMHKAKLNLLVAFAFG
jgi:hypothetical protein